MLSPTCTDNSRSHIGSDESEKSSGRTVEQTTAGPLLPPAWMRLDGGLCRHCGKDCRARPVSAPAAGAGFDCDTRDRVHGRHHRVKS